MKNVILIIVGVTALLFRMYFRKKMYNKNNTFFFLASVVFILSFSLSLWNYYVDLVPYLLMLSGALYLIDFALNIFYKKNNV